MNRFLLFFVVLVLSGCCCTGNPKDKSFISVSHTESSSQGMTYITTLER